MTQLQRTDAFNRLHTIVANGMDTFDQVGNALLEIKDNELYKEAGYKSFANYYQSEFKKSYRTGYRLIAAAKVSNKHNVPNQNVAAKLADVPDEYQEKVLTEAKQRMGEGVTASMIQDVAAEIVPAKEKARPSESQFREILTALGEVSKAIKTLHKGDGRFMYANQALGSIQTLRGIVKNAIPNHACPACFGERSKCHVCDGLGWVNEERLNTMGKQ